MVTTNSDNHHSQKLAAARELLMATKRDLQLVDVSIDRLAGQRSAVSPADDVSSEHRAQWLGAVDDIDQHNGIVFDFGVAVGLANPRSGIIRNPEDSAFICTDILCAIATPSSVNPKQLTFHLNAGDDDFQPLMRLTDGNTGRSLITGMTVGPTDMNRGAVALSYFSSLRAGLGPTTKNRLFSEFTIPRASVVRVDLFNVGDIAARRVFITLLGFKVFGA